VYSKRDGKKIRKTFPTHAAAVAWRNDASTAVRKKLLRAPTSVTVDQAGDAWLEGARAGLIRTRSGEAYKPSAIRAYEKALRLRIRPEIGRRRLSDVSRLDLQDLVEEWIGVGLAASTVGTTLLPLRAIYRRAASRGEIAVNPTAGVELPAVRGGRDRVADPEECEDLLGALKAEDRPIWATAMYAGLRRGELLALRVEDVELGSGVIHVRRGWDQQEGEISTKTRKERRVPIATVLRDYLDERLLRLPWDDGLVFGAGPQTPFATTSLASRAASAWRRGGLAAITLHECRHTFASLMIAAGVNAKALSTYMGHANIAITMDRYGHLMPGNEGEAAGLLDAYLVRATGAFPGASRVPA
jgi:integrase